MASSSSINSSSADNSNNYNNNNDKICIVMGNEEKGISDTMKKLADKSFILPMKGFAESFNLSVATAITLAHMNNQKDLFKGNLSHHEKKYLLFKWMLDSLSQRKIGILLLKKHGIEISDIF